MKILFINKYDNSGGAGIAAFRLASCLKQNRKTENYFLVGIKNSDLPFVYQTRNGGIENFIERGINYLSNLLGMQYFWLPFSSKTILEKIREIKPDIIHLHNAHGGYFELSMLNEISMYAPIVWTLHDMWAFTANAAHTYGDESWKRFEAGKNEKKYFPQIGLPFGSLLLRRKKKIYTDSNLTIVCPSRWLYKLAIQSPVFEGKKIEQIYNGVDLKVFRKLEKEKVRKELGIPNDAAVLMFGAEKLKNEFKGGRDLINILNQLNKKINRQIHLIILGKGKINEFNYEKFIVHSPGYVYDDTQLSKYYNAADLFIYPTKADNLPNTLIEAIACGLPCVSNDVGGCNEIVEDGVNGFLIPANSNHLFSEKVLFLLSNNELRKEFAKNCLDITLKKFSINNSSLLYHNLYKELINM
ncbi:MAG TPA: glycosyltransferase [Ignavibacteriaceae bacterium]|nr:glycosyltransferase [Ignavibacteriaceae bacterium]